MEEVDGAGQRVHGGIHLYKICKKWVSVAVMMKPGALPVTMLIADGYNSYNNQARKIHWTYNAPPDVKTSQRSNRLTPEGGSRRWGRPKQTWQDTFIEDMQKMGVSGRGTQDEARCIASDHADGYNSLPSVSAGTEGSNLSLSKL